MALVQYYGTGRRKTSIARVRLLPGDGKILVNNLPFEEYFALKTLQLIIKQPLELTKTTAKYDIVLRVEAGGLTGQAGAVRHGISRALLKVDGEYRLPLKKAGFLERDAREKERRKYGLEKARKASQFSKR